jgi:hypothetical protein
MDTVTIMAATGRDIITPVPVDAMGRSISSGGS